jgi:chorismate mutase
MTTMTAEDRSSTPAGPGATPPDASRLADATLATPAPAGGADEKPANQTETPSIEDMRLEIDAIDAELVRLIMRRTELSQAIGAARQSQGGTRIVYSREIQILERFRELGPAGTELGMLLLSLGRGTLGRR